MQRASTSGERTPLVPPTYVFDSSFSRRYQKKLRACQCAICITLLSIVGIALLVSVSYNLMPDTSDNSTEVISDTPIPVIIPVAAGNLTGVAPQLAPLLQLKWPLKGRPPAAWVGDPPSASQINSAAAHGIAALATRRQIESARKPLDTDEPANRAQRAAATAQAVKPLADNAYAIEKATEALGNGSDVSKREGGVGVGPPTNTNFPPPLYCELHQPACPSTKYRSIDGSCNNLQYPYRWGVSTTPFRRIIPADYADGISAPRTGVNGSQLPSARDVSVTVHRPSYAHDSTFTVMLAVWGQFLDHDITATALSKGENNTALKCCDPTLPVHPECFPVKLDVEDPFYQDYHVTCMEFVRSAPAPMCNFGPREQLNQATSYIDGSTIYGFEPIRANRLKGVGGELKMLRGPGGRELLPASTDPNDGCNTVEMNAKGRYCFETGDDRANENLHLTTMHLILARQHNRVARILRDLNPSWNETVVYEEARRVIGAQMQHITYTEFLPSVLGEDVMSAVNLTVKSSGYSHSYDPTVDPSIANHFSAAAFRFAHTLLPGLIHKVNAQTGTMDYIHLHEMLFNPYMLYNISGAMTSVQSAYITPIHSADPHVTSELSNHLFERPVAVNASFPLMRPAPCGLDLVSLNIQRGRDHGLPSYPAWRELCGFPRPKTWEDLQGVFDDMSFARISTIYSDVEDIDLYTGGLAEEPHGRLIGATLSCLISDQFLRLKIGDRFWYETDDKEVGFTIEQLTEIRKTTLGGLICANEEMLDEVPLEVMKTISASNPLVDCKELPQPDFSVWKDTSEE